MQTVTNITWQTLWWWIVQSPQHNQIQSMICHNAFNVVRQIGAFFGFWFFCTTKNPLGDESETDCIVYSFNIHGISRVLSIGFVIFRPQHFRPKNGRRFIEKQPLIIHISRFRHDICSHRSVEYIFRIFFVCVMFFWHWCYKNLKHHRISTLWFILSSFRKHVQHSKAYHVEFDTEKMAKHLKIITTLKSLKQTLMVIYRLYPFTELLNDRIDPKLRHAINILFFHLKNRIAQVYRK